MIDWHRALAWALIVTNAVAGAWALAGERWPRLRGRPLWATIGLAHWLNTRRRGEPEPAKEPPVQATSD